MRHLLSLFLALLTCVTAFAAEFTVDGIKYSTSGTEATVKSNSYSGAVTIPSSVTYGGTTYSVTAIGKEAFYGCSGLTSVTIPESVTSIGEYAFDNCSGLTSITIPEGVKSIGRNAFSGCSSLMSINIPEGVKSIGRNTFDHCSSLTSITIPESVSSIGSRAFRDCSSLTSITIVFPYYKELGVSYDAFFGCSNLSSITYDPILYPDIFNSNAIIVFIPHYYGYSSVEEIVLAVGCKNSTIPDGVETIGSSAFYGCVDLKSISIPQSVTKIERYAFSGCTGLTSITIPESVTEIFSYAFDECSGLKGVKCESVTPPSSSGGIPTSATIYIPYGSLAAYQSAWGTDYTYVEGFDEFYAQISTAISPVSAVGAVSGTFDLTGRKVADKPTRSGIYVSNGKKIRVK